MDILKKKNAYMTSMDKNFTGHILDYWTKVPNHATRA